MPNRLDKQLARHPPNSLVARATQGLLGVLQIAPPGDYTTVAEAAAARYETQPEGLLEKAEELGGELRVSTALFAAGALDTGDTGLTVLTGIRTAVALFQTREPQLTHVEQQQVDAAMKALGIALMVDRLLPGDFDESFAALGQIPAGRALLGYFGAMDVALPFVDDVKAGDGRFVEALVDQRIDQVAAKLGRVARVEDVDRAREVLSRLVKLMDQVAMAALPQVDLLSERVMGWLPNALAPHEECLTGLTAAGVDTLPIYRYLGVRLATEAVLYRARQAVFVGPADVSPPPLPPELRTGAPASPDAQGE